MHLIFISKGWDVHILYSIDYAAYPVIEELSHQSCHPNYNNRIDHYYLSNTYAWLNTEVSVTSNVTDWFENVCAFPMQIVAGCKAINLWVRSECRSTLFDNAVNLSQFSGNFGWRWANRQFYWVWHQACWMKYIGYIYIYLHGWICTSTNKTADNELWLAFPMSRHFSWIFLKFLYPKTVNCP